MNEIEQKTNEATSDEDALLIRRARQGERAAWARIVAQHRETVNGIARRALRNDDDAQDVTQETFTYAYLHLNELRDAAKLLAWLRQITYHAAADFRRRRATRRFPPPPFADLATLEAACDQSGERDRKIAVRDALAALPDAQRMTVYLHYIGGYELTETAELLAVPLNTVKSRLRLARAKLRVELDEKLNEAWATLTNEKG